MCASFGFGALVLQLVTGQGADKLANHPVEFISKSLFPRDHEAPGTPKTSGPPEGGPAWRSN
jgi:hypothetical protein